MQIKIGGLIELSLIDVLGYPSSIIFFSGCNFKCPWCHNKEILTKGYEISIKDIITHIKTNYLIDYVQVSGGEPTLQPEGLEYLFREVKKLGLRTSLNTNGSNPKVIKKLIDHELVDHIAMDVKFPLNMDYPFERIIGISDKRVIKNILKTLEILSDFDFVEIRTTLVPELTEDDIYLICEQLNSISDNFIYVLQQCITENYITPAGYIKDISQNINKKFLFKRVICRIYN